MKITNVFKKGIILLLLLVVTISFSACSSVRSMTVENENGTIDELVYVSLDTDKIYGEGYDYSKVLEMKKDIIEKSEEKAEKLIANFRIRLKVLPFVNVGVKVISSGWENDTYAIGLRFDNLDIYQLYYGIDDNSSSDVKKTEEFLYTKHEFKRHTKYYVYQSLYQELETYYNNKYPEFVSSENNETLYTYISDTSRLHSDADYITKQNGKYYYTWEIDSENLDEEIIMYYKIANRGNWMILCIVTTLLFTSILLIISFVIKINHYKKLKNNKK